MQANAVSLRHDPFARLYHNYSRLVISIAAHFPLTPQQQEDVCQDVFVIAWQKREQLQHEYAFASWLSTITQRRCLNEVCSKERKATISLEELSEEAIHAHQEAFFESHGEAWCWRWEMSLGLLHRAIQEHRSPMRRRVAQLFYVEGASVLVIADELKICPNTVVSHLRRFRLIVEKSLLRLADEKGIDLVSVAY